MIISVVLFVIRDLASFAPIFGLIATILLSGYFSAMYYQMVQSSATGADEAPEFPNISNIREDIVTPLVQIVVTAGMCFTPYIIYSLWSDRLLGSSNELLSFALLASGAIYFPMAMLAVVILGSVSAISPHIVLPAICRGGWVYWIGVLLVCALFVVESILFNYFSGFIIAGSLLMSIVGVYTLMTNARILGLVFRERQEELEWV